MSELAWQVCLHRLLVDMTKQGAHDQFFTCSLLCYQLFSDDIHCVNKDKLVVKCVRMIQHHKGNSSSVKLQTCCDHPLAKVAVVADSLVGQCNSALVTVAPVCQALITYLGCQNVAFVAHAYHSFSL